MSIVGDKDGRGERGLEGLQLALTTVALFCWGLNPGLVAG